MDDEETKQDGHSGTAQPGDEHQASQKPVSVLKRTVLECGRRSPGRDDRRHYHTPG